MSHIYLIENKSKIIGVFNDYKVSELYVFSLLQNNIIDDIISINKYILNSGYCTDKIIFNHNNTKIQSTVQPKKNILIEKKIQNDIDNESNILIDNTKNYENLENIAKNKIELQHDINILKKQKEKLIESKQVYETDLKLFEMFTNEINKNPNFIIPELFINKYKIFKKLKLENDLSLESFNLEYKKNKNNDYNDYFKSNDYENNYELLNDNIEEEIILDN